MIKGAVERAGDDRGVLRLPVTVLPARPAVAGGRSSRNTTAACASSSRICPLRLARAGAARPRGGALRRRRWASTGRTTIVSSRPSPRSSATDLLALRGRARAGRATPSRAVSTSAASRPPSRPTSRRRRALGVRCTPTFLINGQPLVGAHPVETSARSSTKRCRSALMAFVPVARGRRDRRRPRHAASSTRARPSPSSTRGGGRFYATGPTCPHEDGPLAEGWLEGDAVVCPWHGFDFELATGPAASNPDLVVPVYSGARERRRRRGRPAVTTPPTLYVDVAGRRVGRAAARRVLEGVVGRRAIARRC